METTSRSVVFGLRKEFCEKGYFCFGDVQFQAIDAPEHICLGGMREGSPYLGNKDRNWAQPQSIARDFLK